jgi:hypothetical protein
MQRQKAIARGAKSRHTPRCSVWASHAALVGLEARRARAQYLHRHGIFQWYHSATQPPREVLLSALPGTYLVLRKAGEIDILTWRLLSSRRSLADRTHCAHPRPPYNQLPGRDLVPNRRTRPHAVRPVSCWAHSCRSTPKRVPTARCLTPIQLDGLPMRACKPVAQKFLAVHDCG